MDIVIRASVIFALLFIALRAMGPRELGDLTPFEFIVTIVIGDLVQQAITQNDFSLTGGALAVGAVLFWTLVLSWTSYFWPGAAKLIEGEPRIVIKDGRFLRRCARPLRITLAEVESAMRENGIASLDEVRLGVLEPDGKLTFVPVRH